MLKVRCCRGPHAVSKLCLFPPQRSQVHRTPADDSMEGLWLHWWQQGSCYCACISQHTSQGSADLECTISLQLDQQVVLARLLYIQSSHGAAISIAHLTSTIRPLHVCTAEAASLPKCCCACRKAVMAAVRLVKDAITACLLDFWTYFKAS